MFQSLFGRRQERGSQIAQIDAHQLAEMRQHRDDLFLLDVRTAGEYEYDGHIEGTSLIPLSLLPARLDELPQDKTIVCVCRSGNRSQTACQHLTAQGISNVINLAGGMIGWKMAGLPHK